MAANTNLHKAKDLKNDEFYTLYEDVESELKHYSDCFKDKSVYCNCDRPEQSAFWQYFHTHFAELGLKMLTATYYNPVGTAYKTEYCGGSDHDINTCIKTTLTGDGDFRSSECIDIMCSCDIIVTNPAFSLFKEMIALLTEHNKQFLLVGNKNAVTCKNVFPLIKDGRIWFGHNMIRRFMQPDGTLKKFGNIGWFTNLGQGKNHGRLVLDKHYDPDCYPKYLNYDGINVDKVSDIPCDYDKIMGVPITYLEKHDPDQFEIIGFSFSECVDELGIGVAGPEWVKLYREQGGTAKITEGMHCLVYIKDGHAVSPYKRVLIKRKVSVNR